MITPEFIEDVFFLLVGFFSGRDELHEDVFTDDGVGGVRARLVIFGDAVLGPRLPQGDRLRNHPLLDFIRPDDFNLKTRKLSGEKDIVYGR